MKQKQTPLAATGWQSRIVRTANVDPATLTPHSMNWRVHSSAQAEALVDVLDRIGWVQNVVVNERTGNILDGHLRCAEAIKRGATIPVVYVDLSEEEERLVLATMDPLAAMAGMDADALAELMEGLELPGALDRLLSDLVGILPDFAPLPMIEGEQVPKERASYTMSVSWPQSAACREALDVLIEEHPEWSAAIDRVST